MEGKTPIVLLVEDDASAMGLMVRLFQWMRFSVRTASDGADALSRMDQNVDLVVTDIEMPCLSGVDFREMIRAKYSAPVIGVTGVRGIDKEELCRHFDALLLKPFRLKELTATVDKLKNKFRLILI